MPQISNHLRRLAAQLFSSADEQERFIDALISPISFDRAVLWVKSRPEKLPFPVGAPFSWQPDFVDRAPADSRPGLDPLHTQGYYYCLDFSSVFAAMSLSVAPKAPELAIDVCAAPGGKAVFASVMLQPEKLICNEVIKKRTGVLIANLRRCDIPAEVTSRDSAVLANEHPQIADLVIVDAPCSGQSLVARGKDSPGCFHPSTINLNFNRQKRILANSAQLTAPGGYLAYMTCTYSEKENERVVQWLLKKFPRFSAIEVPALSDYQSHLTDTPCYRLWPFSEMGAGAFTVLFRAA